MEGLHLGELVSAQQDKAVAKETLSGKHDPRRVTS